ncbi:lecithin retinol acyltransferase-like [Saccostrea cucullata]|uniref:lecithin retinol acyltransferase-like n=1 Tax=Saccostrea cuccullata TaxID=36930 RepID=UPI002ED51CCF
MAHFVSVVCTQTEPVLRIHQLKKGDHIKFHRVAYTHHAIVTDVDYSAEQFEVIESSEKQKIKRRRDTMENYKELPIIYRYTYDGVERNSPEVTVALAEACLQNKDRLPYDLLRNNCEHIANFCATGKHKSLQAERFLKARKFALLAIEMLNDFLT